MQLQGQNIVVFDCEIKNSIDGKNIKWSEHAKMGISVVCLFDFRSMDYMVFLEDNADELVKRLESADLVSGFNINGFDIPLINACLNIKLKVNVYDLLDESRYAVGYHPWSISTRTKA